MIAISDPIFVLVYLLARLSESGDSSAWSFVSKPPFQIINLNKFCYGKIWPSFNLLEPSCFLPPFVFRFFVRFVFSLQPEFLSWTFWFDFLFEFYLCIRWVLIVFLFVCDRVPRVRRLLLRIARFPGSSARKVTLWSCFPTTQFYCIRSILTHCMIRI